MAGRFLVGVNAIFRVSPVSMEIFSGLPRFRLIKLILTDKGFPDAD
jgi:hypothetical protein